MTQPPRLPTGRRGRFLRWAAGLLALVLIGTALWVWYHRRTEREWRNAQAALTRHDLTAAAIHLDRHLASHPDDAAGLFLAARTARRRERFADAGRYLERCQQLTGVTDATRLEWDLLRVQQGDTSGIDSRLRATTGPDHPDALFVLEALARGYIRLERPSDALEACDLWQARDPGQPWPYVLRGHIFERLSLLDRAEAEYRTAVMAAPELADARVALGELLLRQRQPAAAAEQFDVVLTRDSNHLDAVLGLATCRIEEGRPGEAAMLLDRVLDHDPALARALFLRGKTAMQLEAPAQAVGWFREAVRVAPSDPEAVYQLAQAYRAVGAEAEATAATRRADQLHADVKKLDDLIRQIARAPDDAHARHEAGVLALRLGRIADGLRWLNGLLVLKGDHRATHAVLADHYRQTGDRERAEHHQRLAGDS